MPAALAVSTAAFALAKSAAMAGANGAVSVRPAKIAAAIRAIMRKIPKRRVIDLAPIALSEKIWILLNNRLHFLVQADANIGVELCIDADRCHFDPDRRSAGHQHGTNTRGDDQRLHLLHGFPPTAGAAVACAHAVSYPRRSSSKLREVSRVRSTG